MNNEEKLLKLLQIAVENGYSKYKNNLPDNCYLLPIKENYLTSLMWKTDRGTEFVGINCNDLVTNFEEGEVSFIEALCNADKDGKDTYENLTKRRQRDLLIHSVLKNNWSNTPTSQRLNWLFETFEHLL